MNWRPVLPRVFMFEDSCNVYAVQGPEGMLIVNAGSGRWLDHLAELPAKPAALALTHHFRDHAAGGVEAARRGIPVYASELVESILADPEQRFRQTEPHADYDTLWELNAPIEPVPLAGLLLDYDHVRLAGLDVEVLPLPGVTMAHLGLGLRLPGSGKLLVFCGEAIHSPGKLARVAPLQYNANDMGGAVQCFFSAEYLRGKKPDALFPSLGRPILAEADAALSLLQQNLRELCAGRIGMKAMFERCLAPALNKVTDHVYISNNSLANAAFILSDSGKAMVIDYGYRWTDVNCPGHAAPYTRRAILHGLDALKQQFGIDRIDVALPSHYHDDHVCGIPTLQRLFNTQCWCSEAFADLIEHPEAHCYASSWSRPVRVDRRIGIDEKVTWEGYTFHFGAMSGHTRFASLIGFTADGKRFAHTGDQYAIPTSGVDHLHGVEIVQNHMLHIGGLLDGYAQSERWLTNWQPEVVLTGHRVPVFTNDEWYRRLKRHTRMYEDLHRAVMALGDDQPHFNLDSWAGWVWPFRTHLPAVGPANIRVTVRNPFPRAAKLDVRLVGPAGWKGTSATLDAPPRGDVSCELSITPAGPCWRKAFAVELVADGRPFGQVAEGLVTAGYPAF